MAGAMRRMGIYLGLVEEDDRYDEYGEYDDYEDEHGYDEPEKARDVRDVRDVHDGREAHGATRAVHGVHGGGHAVASREERTRTIAAVRDESRPAERRPSVVQPTPVGSLDRITTIHPRAYNDAKTIGETFRGGIPVIMNLTDMDDQDAKRLVDFAAGLVFGLRGTIERVTNKVFLLSPANVSVTAEDKARMAESGFFNQS
ncbi:MAG: cell division protein SepF [Motilibacteraceae bacterium]